MSGGLVGLLDDIASLAKMAAASVDDVSAAAGRASAKAAGVVVDDTAVTPAYVHGLAAERELPIIRRIATGSLRNKLLFILPAALLLSEFVPLLVEIILMFGGAYLAFEGAEKVHHRLAAHDAARRGKRREAADLDRTVDGKRGTRAQRQYADSGQRNGFHLRKWHGCSPPRLCDAAPCGDLFLFEVFCSCDANLSFVCRSL